MQKVPVDEIHSSSCDHVSVRWSIVPHYLINDIDTRYHEILPVFVTYLIFRCIITSCKYGVVACVCVSACTVRTVTFEGLDLETFIFNKHVHLQNI